MKKINTAFWDMTYSLVCPRVVPIERAEQTELNKKRREIINLRYINSKMYNLNVNISLIKHIIVNRLNLL